jgi:urease accessory protein
MTPAAALLLLADGRFPAGGHVHSAGVEAAVGDGRVADVGDLRAFLVGRLHTAGLADASLAAATAHRLAPGELLVEVVRLLDAEAGARQPVPPLRAASRRLGRQLLRVAGRCWTHPVLAAAPSDGLHHPVALGAVAVAAGLTAPDAAALAVHHVLSTPAQAAVRLLGLDPFAVVALLAELAPEAEAVAGRATVAAEGPLDELPAGAGPLVEIAALDHEHWPIRMFAT